MAHTRPILGILGGLGPAATVDFYAKLVAATPALTDQDHLHVIIDADPSVPNRNEAVAGTGPSPAPQLAAMAVRLEAAGAEALFMVCNAAHAFAGAITSAVGVPLVSIVDETVDATLAAAPNARRVGVLAAAGAQDARLYATAFAARGVGVLEPVGERRDRFMSLLYRVKAGETGTGVREAMLALARELTDDGAEAIVAGCTEVPLVLNADDLAAAGLSAPLVSSTDALVAAAVAIGTGVRPLPLRAPR
ncbi:MAG: amino acid racemase [Trueperaceae bacterium]